MAKTKITGFIIFICMGLLVMSACTKKKIPVSPQTSEEVSRDTVEETIATPETEMEEAEAVRQQRLAELQAEEEKKAADVRGLMDAKIHFEFDRSDLSAEARETLKKIADLMQTYPSWTLDISGHCDERGTIEYNLALGERRARSAKNYLVRLGISADRISTISYGEERSMDPRSTEEAWAKNRRCEFGFIKS